MYNRTDCQQLRDQPLFLHPVTDAIGINSKTYCIYLHFLSHLQTYNNYNHRHKMTLMAQRVWKC